jgi:hypothetical protein
VGWKTDREGQDENISCALTGCEEKTTKPDLFANKLQILRLMSLTEAGLCLIFKNVSLRTPKRLDLG